MSKPKSTRKAPSRSKSKKATSPKTAVRKIASKTPVSRPTARPELDRQPEAPSPTSVRTESKQAQVLAMLRLPAGATINSLMQATGWQQHSVRGFLAGVVRKKLGLNLNSEAHEHGRIYRIDDGTAASAAIMKPRQAARCDAAIKVNGSKKC